MALEHLSLAITDGVAVVTLDRPPVNALNSAVMAELGEVAASLSGRRDLRGVVLTGQGKAFVAGADIGQMADLTAEQAHAFAAQGQVVSRAWENLPMPTVAAVNGFALGGGCELALCCDLILAGPKALFGQPEVKLGVIPGFGGTQRLRDRVGTPRAKELIYTGRSVTADEAVALGLALSVEEDAVAAAVALCHKIGRNGPNAVALAKRAMD